MPKLRLQLGPPKYELATEQLAQRARPGYVFDFSMIDLYLGCHRAYYYRHELNRRAIGSTAHPLILGGGLHESMNAHYYILKESSPKPPHTFDYLEHLEAMERAFLAKVHPDVLANRFPIFEDDQPDGKRYVLNAWRILSDYLQTYPREDFEIVDIEIPVAIIIPFEYRDETEEVDREGEIVYVGRIDLVIHWMNHFHIVEHKTAFRLDKNYFKQYRPNHQITGYLAALRELKGINAHWALINAIGVYKDGSKKAKELTTQFERDRVRRENEEVKSFERQIANITREIFWYRSRIKQGEDPEDVFYQNPKSCFKWNTTCQFHTLCTKASKNGRMGLMQSAYEQEVWSPYEIYDSESEES